MVYWLLKSEPNVYSIHDLHREKTCVWDGVRNYQARNFLRKMKSGDLAFFYHSNTKPPGIVGLVRVVETLVNDPTQFDPESEYYDPHSHPDKPRWQTVRVELVELYSKIITLDTLKQEFSPDDFLLVRRGNRLSVMPILEEIAEKILVIQKNQ